MHGIDVDTIESKRKKKIYSQIFFDNVNFIKRGQNT